jgi:hypothetical protein
MTEGLWAQITAGTPNSRDNAVRIAFADCNTHDFTSKHTRDNGVRRFVHCTVATTFFPFGH